MYIKTFRVPFNIDQSFSKQHIIQSQDTLIITDLQLKPYHFLNIFQSK